MIRRKNKQDTQISEESNKSEIEQLTDDLIRETNEILQKQFEELTKKHSAQANPLKAEEAQNILFSLIRTAAAQRRLLAGRIEKSIDKGNLFNEYYDKMKYINELTVNANANMKKMKLAKELYENQLAVYKKVTGKTYKKDMELENSKALPIKEVWKELDEGGGY